MPDSNRIDRRQFAGSLAAASSVVAAVLVSSINLDADDKSSVDPKGETLPQEVPDKAAQPPEELLLLTYLMRHYPCEHFDQTAVRGIFGDLRGDLARSRVLSEFRLKNSDEPGFVFRAFRGL